MLHRVREVTSSDFTLIELESGKRYEMTGKQVVVSRSELSQILAAHEPLPERFEGHTSTHDHGEATIEYAVPSQDGSTFTFYADDGSSFELTGREARTVLDPHKRLSTS